MDTFAFADDFFGLGFLFLPLDTPAQSKTELEIAQMRQE